MKQIQKQPRLLFLGMLLFVNPALAQQKETPKTVHFAPIELDFSCENTPKMCGLVVEKAQKEPWLQAKWSIEVQNRAFENNANTL